MSDLVGNPEDRFSRVEARMIVKRYCEENTTPRMKHIMYSVNKDLVHQTPAKVQANCFYIVVKIVNFNRIFQVCHLYKAYVSFVSLGKCDFCPYRTLFKS